MIKTFEEYIKENVVKKVAVDKERAKFLINEAEKNYSFLQKVINKLGIDNESANNYIKSCYDILMELIRAKLYLVGYYCVGQGAHEAEVAYLKVIGFSESDVKLADQIRYFRNGMLYYGTILDKEYAEKVIEFTKRIYKELMGILSK